MPDFEEERWHEPIGIGMLPDGTLLVVNPNDPTPSVPGDMLVDEAPTKKDRARNFVWEDDDIIITPIVEDYDPNQPRNPKGSEAGGQWQSESGQNFVAFAKQSSEKTLGRGLTPEEEVALEVYTSHRYKDINKVLRGGPSHEDVRLYDTMETLDNLFKEAKLDRDLIVYRAVSKDTLEKMATAGSFEDRGFTSTTTDMDTADAFGKETRGRSRYVVVKMKLPKGSRALAIAHASDVPGEREVLVARGSRWPVVQNPQLGRVELTLI